MTHRRRTLLALIGLLALLSSACGGDVSTTTTTELTTSTSAPPETTTTTAPSTTTSTSSDSGDANPSLEFLYESGYTYSDEYVVEVAVRDIDSGTGGLAVAEDGTFFQADFGYPGHVGNSVYRIGPDGTVETFAQSDDMESLTMTTFGADGNLYQSSYGSGQLFRLGDDGSVELVAEGIGGPTGIVALEDGTLFVEGYNSGILHKIEPDGTMTEFATHPDFNGINGLTIGPDGTLYAVNHRDGGLFSITQDGTVTKLHEFPWQTSHVAYLDGLFITSRGIFIIYRYDLETGETHLIAGNAEPGDMDGRGIESSFGRPNAITVGPDGSLYFNHADGSSNSPVHIRRITHQP